MEDENKKSVGMIVTNNKIRALIQRIEALEKETVEIRKFISDMCMNIDWKKPQKEPEEKPFTLKGKEQYLELSDNGVWTIVDDYDKEQDEHGMYHIIINKSDVDKAYDEICKEIDKDSDTWEGSIIIPEWLYKKRAKEIVKQIMGRD